MSVDPVELSPAPCASTVNASVFDLIVKLLLLRLRNVSRGIWENCCVSRLNLVLRVHAAKTGWSWYDRDRHWHAIVVSCVSVVALIDVASSVNASAAYAAATNATPVNAPVNTSTVNASTVNARMPNCARRTRL